MFFCGLIKLKFIIESIYCLTGFFEAKKLLKNFKDEILIFNFDSYSLNLIALFYKKSNHEKLQSGKRRT
jgi:hypothetical protein